MTEWVLVIIFGISNWGAGGQHTLYMPDKDTCYEAMANIRVSGQLQTSGDDDEQTIIYCAPKQ